MEKATKKGGKSGELSQNEQLILDKVGLGIVTVKKLGLSTGFGKTTVYNILKKLRVKGLLRKGMEKTDPTIPLKAGNYFRLHGADFNIRIIYQDERYEKIRKDRNKIITWVGGHKIVLFKNTIEVYGKCSFEAECLQKAFYDSLKYWDVLFCKLEAEFKVMLVKPRSNNISCVMLHYAEVNNGVAEEVHREENKLKIYGSDDGKLWCICDFSNKNNEFETVHGERGKQDMEVCQRYLNDWRDNEPPTNSEIMRILRDIVEANKETAAGLSAVVALIKPLRTQDKEEGVDLDEKPRYIG